MKGSLGDFRDPDNAIDALKKAVAEGAPGEVFNASHGAWSFCYSFEPNMGHIFSAQLRQRSSKERDWTILGRCAARIGAPEDARPSTITTHPEASHYFIWGGVRSREQVQASVDLGKKLYAEAQKKKSEEPS